MISIELVTPLIQNQFEFPHNNPKKEIVTLVEVTELPGNGSDRKSFSMLFIGHQKEYYYNQGTYPMKLPDGSIIDIFLVPLGFTEEGMKYEAIFN